MVQRGPASAFSIAESFAAVPGSTFRRTAARPSVPIGPLVTETAVSAFGLGGRLPPKPLFVLPLGGPGAKRLPGRYQAHWRRRSRRLSAHFTRSPRWRGAVRSLPLNDSFCVAGPLVADPSTVWAVAITRIPFCAPWHVTPDGM